MTASRIGWVAVAALAAASLVSGGDWPQFRGPQRDGVARGETLLKTWPADGPKRVWRTELGEGYSGVTVVGGRLYTMFAKGSDEYVAAFDAAGGKELWRHRVDETWIDRFGNGPRSTPTIDGTTVYALSGRGKLHALKAVDGTALWKRDLDAEFGAKPPTWGVSASPLVEGRLLLLDVGGRDGASVVAFDKKTGKEVWRAGKDKAGYSTPLALEIGGLRQVVFFTGTSVVGVAPGDGKLLWDQPWKTSYDVNAAAPVFVPPDSLFVSSGYDVGGALYRIHVARGAVSLEQVWKNREMKNQFSSSVFHAGNLYGFDDKTLKCVSAATGETRWKARGFGHGSLIFADGHLLVLGDEGTLALVEATGQVFREKARTKIFEGKTWTVPTLVDGRLYIRDENELISLDVSG